MRSFRLVVTTDYVHVFSRISSKRQYDRALVDGALFILSFGISEKIVTSSASGHLYPRILFYRRPKISTKKKRRVRITITCNRWYKQYDFDRYMHEITCAGPQVPVTPTGLCITTSESLQLESASVDPSLVENPYAHGYGTDITGLQICFNSR